MQSSEPSGEAREKERPPHICRKASWNDRRHELSSHRGGSCPCLGSWAKEGEALGNNASPTHVMQCIADTTCIVIALMQ